MPRISGSRSRCFGGALFALWASVLMVACILDRSDSSEDPPLGSPEDTVLYATIRPAGEGRLEAGDFAPAGSGATWSYACVQYSVQSRVSPYTDDRDTTHYTLTVLNVMDSGVTASYREQTRMTRTSTTSGPEGQTHTDTASVEVDTILFIAPGQTRLPHLAGASALTVGGGHWLPFAPERFRPLDSLDEVRDADGKRRLQWTSVHGVAPLQSSAAYLTGVGLKQASYGYSGLGNGQGHTCSLVSHVPAD